MKKVIVVSIILMFSTLGSKAQGTLNLGVNFALPIESARSFSDIGLGLESAYMYEIMETFDLGASVGLTVFNARNNPKLIFIPIAASASFLASKDFTVITDFGYALGVNKGNKGGYYYKPKLNYMLNEFINFNIFYSGITRFEGSQWTSLGAGITYTFHKD